MTIYLQCPACGYRFLAAILEPQDHSSPATIANQRYCPRCHHNPPMHLVPDLPLFSESQALEKKG